MRDAVCARRDRAAMKQRTSGALLAAAAAAVLAAAATAARAPIVDALLLSPARRAVPWRSAPSRRRRRCPSSHSGRIPAGGGWQRPLHATVYYPSADESALQGDDDGDFFETSAECAPSATPIPERLRSQAWTAPLARLAAAFCQTGALSVRHIEHVSVRAVDASHVDLEAVVCEADGCVSLSVPVTFAHPCDSENLNGRDLEECILQNIIELDEYCTQQQLAASSTAGSARAGTEDEAVAALAALRSTDNVEFPSWWVHSGSSIEFANGCDSLLQILNEHEFSTDLLKLVRTELLGDEESRWIVHEAAAVAVGPAGLILRARLYDDDDDIMSELVEIPVSFGAIASDTQSVRDAVLECVESGA